jgi:asparagine synthase (glutamine-hydrolysing)
MCGITGFMSATPVAAEPIVGMNDLVRHRGPDDEGFLLLRDRSQPLIACHGRDTPPAVKRGDGSRRELLAIDDCKSLQVNAALGHRRLSIMDLSALGHQPMSSPDERYWIVYNGELYNHVELRAELEALGHRFSSRSDTEVVLAAYAQWGPDCLPRFNGMWAFAIYDIQEERLFLSRDRFGIKPLYYWISPQGTFCFASEIKQFTAFPGWRAAISPQAAYAYLVWSLTEHSEETMFASVRQLSPGHFLQVDRDAADGYGRLREQQWYQLKPAPFSGSFDDAAAAFRKHFEDAVRLHLRADVPIGTCLSGGLDSSSIVCVMNRMLREKDAGSLQKTFSACSDVEHIDERKWIEKVVRATGVEANYVLPEAESLFEESARMTWHQDQPVASTSCYAQWNVFRLASRQGVKVMLDGQGADEQLAGYHAYFGPRFAALFTAGRWLVLWNEIQRTKQLHGYSEKRAVMHLANILLPEMIGQPLRALAGRTHVRPGWLNMERLGAVPENPLAGTAEDMASIRGMSHAQLTSTNLQMLLRWEDRSSMAHSVESRVPFLDHRLVEFVLGLPDEYKLAQGMTKRVLREAMKGVLPEPIRTRVDKIGFATPEEVWTRSRLSEQYRSRMRKAIDTSEGIIGASAMRELEHIISGEKRFTSLPWRLINFGEWIEAFSVNVRH